MKKLKFLLFRIMLLLLAPSSMVEAADHPLPTSEAAAKMTLPPGFKATLFAGEPDIVQPIAMTFDDRGRLWVAECLSYPDWQRDVTQKGHDRIVVLEDETGAGRFTKKTVFASDLNNVSGLEIGFGGVWVCSTPQLLFISADVDADRPAPQASPRVILDGWDLDGKHNVFNRLTWGPDGWLYGCNGILSRSKVGAPGTPDAKRTEINCGVWRYHPLTHVFEVVANGTTNPWGLDFDEHGQIFITNCVIEHLFHVIPGGHYKRMFGQDLNANCFGLLQTCADHIHWAGGDWTTSRGGFGAHSQAGGGHAHAGCMIYLGDNWPDSYRGSAFMCNIHGNRVNCDLLEPHGSGVVAHHGQDFLLANDTWFRGLNLIYGPDGAVYVNDWCDTGECHNHVTIDRTNGRLFKIAYGDVKSVHPNLSAESDESLAGYATAKNQWWARHARRLLEEHAATRPVSDETVAALSRILDEDPDPIHQLNALWALYGATRCMPDVLDRQLANKDPYVRGWAIQLATQSGRISASWNEKLAALAHDDPSPVVRLFIASALQRLPLEARWPIAANLAGHAEDCADANLPLMIWYGLEPAVGVDPPSGMAAIASLKMPILREYIARRVTDPAVPARLGQLVRLLSGEVSLDIQSDVIRGMDSALHEESHVAMPDGWTDLARKLAADGNAELRGKVMSLSATFGDVSAFAALRGQVLDASAASTDREAALTSLVLHHDPQLSDLLTRVLSDKAMAGPALRALAQFPGGQTSKLILDAYPRLADSEKGDAINTLTSRAAWAVVLLDAITVGEVPRTDISTIALRRLRSIKDNEVDRRLTKIWGVVRTSSEDKKTLIAKFKAEYTPEVVKKANVSNGRVVFTRTCAQCHTLFDAGGKVGPILTGAQRSSLEYLFENILDPSAIVAREYLMVVVKTTDDRIIDGIIQSETSDSITLRTATEDVVVRKSDIAKRTTSTISMMPEGLLESLSPTDCRDLLGYLGSPEQVALPR